MTSAPQAAPSVTDDAYRAVMRLWPSGVTVITMLGPEGPHGMTASAFTSVSIHPPLVLVVIDKRWRSHDYLAAADGFCVNVLADDQEHVSDRFAGRHGEMDDRFFDIDITAAPVTGAPVLASALGHLDCLHAHRYEAGDHTIFVGRVVGTGVHREGGEPLLYHDRGYRRLAPRNN